MNQEDVICAFITSEASRGNFGIQKELLQFIERNFNKTLTYGWIHSFLHRSASHVRRMTILSQKMTRMQIPRSYLGQYIVLMDKSVPLAPAELIFDMDETGLSDWEEHRPKRNLVSSEASDANIHDPVDRRIRHQTLLCCISASGDVYCPLLISSYRQAGSAFDRGIREGIDAKIEVRDSPYMTAELFEQ
jgi:hypothetical protein